VASVGRCNRLPKMDGTRGRLVYKISVEPVQCDPIRGCGSLPPEDLKWMNTLGVAVGLAMCAMSA
jgi:hypothetical protein